MRIINLGNLWKFDLSLDQIFLIFNSVDDKGPNSRRSPTIKEMRRKQGAKR